MTQIQTTNGTPTLAPTDMLRVRADQADTVRAFGDPSHRGARHLAGSRPMTWREARATVDAADAADGRREDVAIGDLAGWAPCPTADGTIGLVRLSDPRTVIPMRERAYKQWTKAACGASADVAAHVLGLSHKVALVAMFDGSRRRAEGPALLRMAGGEARALLSDTYAPIDNGRVLDACEKALARRGLLDRVQVRNVMTGATTCLRVTVPVEIPADVKAAALARPDHAWINAGAGRADAKGSPIEIGFDLRNGEVGNASVSITPVTVRLVCLNGLTREDREATRRLRHVGDPSHRLAAIVDSIDTALDLATGLRDAQIRAGERMIDDALAELGILTALGFTAGEGRAAIEHAFAAEHGVTVDASKALAADLPKITIGDLMNGATLYAQTLGTDRRLDLEAAAGAYVMRRAA